MTLTYEKGGKVLASAEVVESPDCVEVRNLVAGGGAGAYLGSQIVELAGDRPIYLQADIENEKAIMFYIKAGFEITHVVMRKAGR